MGDASRLQQVCWNLLANAVKFTPAGGHVEVRLSARDDAVDLVVSDTGEGVPPSFLPHVFERFRQAEATLTRSHGGLGLGLSLVRDLVELHGGAIRVESSGQGRGTTFTVRLPRGRAPSPPAYPPVRSPSSIDLEGVRVLVVDDEADALELITTVLQSCGAEVRVAVSAADALDTLKRVRPDVLLSDIAMPREDGYSLIRRVRSLAVEDGGAIPAAALTASHRDRGPGERPRGRLPGPRRQADRPGGAHRPGRGSRRASARRRRRLARASVRRRRVSEPSSLIGVVVAGATAAAPHGMPHDRASSTVLALSGIASRNPWRRAASWIRAARAWRRSRATVRTARALSTGPAAWSASACTRRTRDSPSSMLPSLVSRAWASPAVATACSTCPRASSIRASTPSALQRSGSIRAAMWTARRAMSSASSSAPRVDSITATYMSERGPAPAEIVLRLEGGDGIALEAEGLVERAAAPEREPEVLLRRGDDEGEAEPRGRRQRLGQGALGLRVGADLEVGVAQVAALHAADPAIAHELALRDRALVPAHALVRIAEDARLDAAGHVEGRERRRLHVGRGRCDQVCAGEHAAGEGVLAGPEERSRQARERVDEVGRVPFGLDVLQLGHDGHELARGAEGAAHRGELARRHTPARAAAGQRTHGEDRRVLGQLVLAAPPLRLALDEAQAALLLAVGAAGDRLLDPLERGGEVVALERLLRRAAIPRDRPQRLAATFEVLGEHEGIGLAGRDEPRGGEAVAERAVLLREHGVGGLVDERVVERELP